MAYAGWLATAQSRGAMDMNLQGRSMSVFQAQLWSIRILAAEAGRGAPEKRPADRYWARAPS